MKSTYIQINSNPFKSVIMDDCICRYAGLLVTCTLPLMSLASTADGNSKEQIIEQSITQHRAIFYM